MNYTQEQQIAIAAVTNAARLCQQVRAQQNLVTLAKADRSPVTVADFGSQALICQALLAAFPEDPIVAEEDAQILQQPAMANCLAQVTHHVQNFIPQVSTDEITAWINHGNGQMASRFWTLDPIDGTKGFIRGAQYAIALALIEQGEVKVGVLACPALPLKPTQPQDNVGVLLVAVKDQGTQIMTLDGTQTFQVQVNHDDNVNKLHVIESVESAHSDRNQQQALAKNLGLTQTPLRMDSQAKYGAIARGEADLYLRIPFAQAAWGQENIWDHAAGALVVTEAGGQVTDLKGQPLDFSLGSKLSSNRGIVASNGLIHQRILAGLQEIGV